MMPIQVNVDDKSITHEMLKIVFLPRFQVHQAYQRQGVFFNYLMSCHDLWEQADMLVARGNHTGKQSSQRETRKSLIHLFDDRLFY